LTASYRGCWTELTGPAFSPSGKRLYFSSQRGARLGMTFEVRGPFRTKPPVIAAAAAPRNDGGPVASSEPAYVLAAPPADVEPGPAFPDARYRAPTPPTPDAGGEGLLGGAALLWLAAALTAFRNRGIARGQGEPD
jgi:hypothetical protein